MSFWTKIFNRPENNALVVLEKSNSELRQLLFLANNREAKLLEQLDKALDNLNSNSSQTIRETPGQPTNREADLLKVFSKHDRVTSKMACEALHYRTMQVGSAMLLRMERKKLIHKIAFGKNTAYAKGAV